MKNWSIEEIRKIYDLPLFALLSQAHAIHRENHTIGEIQLCRLISIKTGGCTEDCKYCSQSIHYKTATKPEPFLLKEEMVRQAQEAIEKGATRVCLAAGWRGIKEGKIFDHFLSAVEEISSMGVEVCGCLGLLNAQQAEKIKEAGCFAYNHNLDTSQEYYPHIISTRTFEDRLDTLASITKAGLSVCCGGIIGLGESISDRISLIHTLATVVFPESVPINCLEPIAGTPLAKNKPPSLWELVRMIATVRHVLPKAMIRLSAGRLSCRAEEQTLCFFAGANSIFFGEKLLTVSNPSYEDDTHLFATLGLTAKRAASTQDF